MKFVNFEKFKNYLGSIGYTLDKGKDDYSQTLGFITYFFSHPTNPNKYFVNVFTDCEGNGANVMGINYGYGSIFSGNIKKVNIDMRTNFWKNMTI